MGSIGAIVLGLSTTTYVWTQRSPAELNLAQYTVPAKEERLTLEISSSGTVTPAQSVNISPKTAGVVNQLLVEQGDRIEQGQIIARMDSSDLQGDLIQAQASLAQAEAQLEEVRNGNRPEEIAQAKAQMDSAEAELAERESSRPLEIAEIENQIATAQAEANLTQQRLERYQMLVRAGAETQDTLDEVIANHRSTQANLQEIQHRLGLVKEQTSREIERAAASLKEAQQAYQLALSGSRPEVIAQAEATVLEARGRLQTVKTQLEDNIIRAPFSGIITQQYATVGSFVTPTTSASVSNSATSTSIVALARDLEVLAKIPEVDIGQIYPGQQVNIQADAYPAQIFQGRVRLVSPEAVVEDNVASFEASIQIDSGRNKLLSGMNTTLTFLGDTVDDALVVPTVAIATQQGQTGVYIPGDDREPTFQPITVGTTMNDQTQVLDGLEPDQRVFIDMPPGLKPEDL